MPKPKIFLTALFAITLLNVSIAGYAQNGLDQNGYAQKGDCRSCHAPNGDVSARDFSSIYANPKAHHPVGVPYPVAEKGDPNFKLPDGHSADVTFFDRNGNGQPDSDEIQLFGTNGMAFLTCASCHREHGATPLPANAPANYYLRVKDTGSALCSNCHNQ